ncbi:MAG: TetR/AcrR family transcriptional regulator [Xanthobacteraceae bacterium]|nr:MAG: TetR/AcrR family transcriptional regulator [Xanthobacteraceae bacterium]
MTVTIQAARTKRKKNSDKTIERKKKTVDKILKCAINHFVRDGYLATTVDQIALSAGLTKGAVYFNFASKEDILRKLLTQAEELIVDQAIDLVKNTPPSAINKLAVFMNHQASVALTHAQHLLLLILMSIEFFGSNTEIEVCVRAIYRRLYSCVESIIHLGQVEGSIRKDIRSHELTSIVMAEHDGVLIEWYRRPGELEGMSLNRAARATLIDGIKARS